MIVRNRRDLRFLLCLWNDFLLYRNKINIFDILGIIRLGEYLWYIFLGVIVRWCNFLLYDIGVWCEKYILVDF